MNVIVEDVNDNAPVFTNPEYNASVSEDESVGFSVLSVSASDADQPGTANSRVRYTFDGGDSGNGSFYIEPSGGKFTRTRVSRATSIWGDNYIVHALCT